MAYTIETIDGTKYTWQVFSGLRTHGVTTYCADGDGFIEVRTINGVFGLYDQNERIRTFHADNLADALRYAEIYADAVYPTMLHGYEIEPDFNTPMDEEDQRDWMTYLNTTR